MLAPLRFLFALTAATAVGARAEAGEARAGPLAREVERACEDADVLCRTAPTVLDRLLACAAEPATETPPADEDAEEKTWSWDLTGYWVDPPEDDAYASAILRADRGALHLEARYNYEDIDTGSIFAGWTFAWSGDVEFSLVPMLGAVFGHTQGVAPGLELDLVWRVLELYVEAEYVFDTNGQEDSFFYSWSEFTVNPTEWLSFGLVAQRTRAYQTDTEFDWGPLLGFHVGSVTATAYVFNLGTDDPYVMVGIGISF